MTLPCLPFVDDDDDVLSLDWFGGGVSKEEKERTMMKSWLYRFFFHVTNNKWMSARPEIRPTADLSALTLTVLALAFFPLVSLSCAKGERTLCFSFSFYLFFSAPSFLFLLAFFLSSFDHCHYHFPFQPHILTFLSSLTHTLTHTPTHTDQSDSHKQSSKQPWVQRSFSPGSPST